MYVTKEHFRPFEKKLWLASPTMHGEEMQYVREAYDTNWMSTVGANITAVEQLAAEQAGVKYAVALSSCTAALHLCVKLAGERLYGRPAISHGTLEGRHVFCSDMTFSATLNPVVYEGGIPVFIDTDRDSWNMSPTALERAFALYPDVKLVVYAELYGFPGNIQKIRQICHAHGALLIEDAAEAMGAFWDGAPCGGFGDYAAVSYNGNKIITGSTGGCLLTNDISDANQARKWSTQARENAAWYQHEEVGYNYRMSNVIAGVIRGQYPHLEAHIAQKKAIYDRYREGLKALPVQMNPFDRTAQRTELLALRHDHKSRGYVRAGSERFGGSLPSRARKVLPDGNSGGDLRSERRRAAYLEADAYAAHVSHARVCNRQRLRARKNKRLHRRKHGGYRRRYFPSRAVPPERQQNDGGTAGTDHRCDPRML